MALKLHTAATGQVVTTAEAKVQLRVTHSAEDALIAGMIGAATEQAEHLMGRALLPQKWQLTLDAFAPVLELQRPPVTAVDTVKYVDASGVLVTMDPAAYLLAKASDYTATLHPAHGTSWPTARSQPEAVQVVFSCGYADAAAVPLARATVDAVIANVSASASAASQAKVTA
jgi:uncharacterized phiE125 gp8 family phage protein